MHCVLTIRVYAIRKTYFFLQLRLQQEAGRIYGTFFRLRPVESPGLFPTSKFLKKNNNKKFVKAQKTFKYTEYNDDNKRWNVRRKNSPRGRSLMHNELKLRKKVFILPQSIKINVCFQKFWI